MGDLIIVLEIKKKNISLKGMFAFFMELRPGYKYIEDTFEEHEKCDIMEIEFLEVSDPWYAMRKFSPYKEMLKVK